MAYRKDKKGRKAQIDYFPDKVVDPVRKARSPYGKKPGNDHHRYPEFPSQQNTFD